MRFLFLFKKAMIENFRDWKIISLTLLFAPLFVFMMYFYFDNTPTVYKTAIVNLDQGAIPAKGIPFNAGEILIKKLEKLSYSDGTNIMEVTKNESMDSALKQLSEKDVDVIVEIPPSFSQSLLNFRIEKQAEPVVVRTLGDPSNAKYIMAAVWCDSVIYACASSLTGQDNPVEIDAQSISNVKSLTDFDLYVPGLLVLAFMILMFSSAATLIREKDKGTIIRLRISTMRPFEWFSAVGLSQIIIGLLGLGLTYASVTLLGYRSSGSFFAVLVVGILSCVSIIAISLIIAALLRTIFDLMTVGVFPFFILMFFSGGLFPLPSITLFKIGNYPILLTFILPTSHSIKAYEKILNYGMGLKDIAFELMAISFLSFVYSVIGVWIFSRRHLRAR